MSRSSEGTANCGVPKNTTRMRYHLPARELLDLADDEVLLQAPESIDEERAVEVIHLVLEAAGEEACRLNGLLVAVAIQSLEHRAHRPRHRCIEARCAQAAFLFELHAIALDERRVDERQQLAGVSAHRDITDEDT